MKKNLSPCDEIIISQPIYSWDVFTSLVLLFGNICLGRLSPFAEKVDVSFLIAVAIHIGGWLFVISFYLAIRFFNGVDCAKLLPKILSRDYKLQAHAFRWMNVHIYALRIWMIAGFESYLFSVLIFSYAKAEETAEVFFLPAVFLLFAFHILLYVIISGQGLAIKAKATNKNRCVTTRKIDHDPLEADFPPKSTGGEGLAGGSDEGTGVGNESKSDERPEE